MERLTNIKKQIEKLQEKEFGILNKLELQLKNCNVIDDTRVDYNDWFTAHIRFEIKLNCSWGYVLTLNVKEDETYEFSTSNGGLNDSQAYLKELNVATSELLKLVENFDYSIFKELKSISEQVADLRYEYDKIQKEIKIKNLTKDLVEMDIDEMIKDAENGKIVKFLTLTGTSLSTNVLYKEKNRFKINGKVIAKSKIKNTIQKAYKA